MMRFDIVHAADPRFFGGSTSAVRVELLAAAKFGVSSALIPFVGTRHVRGRRFDKRIADTIAMANVAWLTGEEPVECDLLLAHHPFVFRRMPSTPLRVRAKQVVCVVQHPPFNGAWDPEYDLDSVARNLERMFGAPVTFAPVGPRVRAQFESLGPKGPALLSHDFTNLIDLSEWPARSAPPPREYAVIGRHSRKDPLKWPDSEEAVRSAYPDANHIQVKVLGGVPDNIKPWIGPNWSILPFIDDGIADFLSKLDFYVFFHSRRWVEAFGISVAEAMACGAVTVLDRSFEPLFEDGAVYATPEETLELINRLMRAPADFSQQSRAGRSLVQRKFSIDTYPQRMRQLYAQLELPPPPSLSWVERQISYNANRAEPDARGPLNTRLALPRRKRVLFVATNGIGLGHITRLMAVAERMSGDVEPVFMTMSAGSSLIHARGHAVDYIPSARGSGVTENSWNLAYAQELLAAIEVLDLAAVVFDSNYPFPGLVSVLDARPDICWVWIRRGMWAPHHVSDPIMNADFDMIIEPSEFARDEDHGVTSTMRDGIVVVDPILLIDPEARLSREAAAAALGVHAALPTALLQLGSERNFDISELRSRIVAELLQRGVQVVEAMNPLAVPTDAPLPGTFRKNIYPMAEYFQAIDLCVTTAGYNSFHECIFAGLPTIFVPNEAPEMDDQHVRAAYARSAGLGLCLRASEGDRVTAAIDLALSDTFRAEHRRRSDRLRLINGAGQAAAAIEELVFSVRTDRPLNAALPRA